MRSVSRVLAMAAFVWTCVVVGMGCNKKLDAPDLISPKADIQITNLQLTAGEILAPTAAGATGNVTSSSADFPQVVMRLTIFNGIAVNLVGFRVDYFTEDGLTPLGLSPFTGVLQRRIDAGTLTENGATSITPGTVPLIAGAVSNTDFRLKVVSDELRSFLAGPDGRFRQFAEDTTTLDDFRSLVVARLRIQAVDINGNHIDIPATISVAATVPQPGGSTATAN
jgi:hypothetical protein